MPSFDIVSQVNSMEIENAVNIAKKELANIPALPAVWKDTLQRLQRTDPDLFEQRPHTVAA